jgi:riboflavin synthase
MGDSRIGDSVSVNGVCLTVTEIDNGLLRMYASRETTSRTTWVAIEGDEVNLERALNSLTGSEDTLNWSCGWHRDNI